MERSLIILDHDAHTFADNWYRYLAIGNACWVASSLLYGWSSSFFILCLSYTVVLHSARYAVLQGYLTSLAFVDVNVLYLYATAVTLIFLTGGFDSPWILMLFILPNWTDLGSRLPVGLNIVNVVTFFSIYLASIYGFNLNAYDIGDPLLLKLAMVLFCSLIHASIGYTQMVCLNLALNRSKEAVNEKALFVANVSHEMRTPLFSIIGWTELLLDMDLDAKQAEIANTIAFCSRHMLGIINQVLDYSKIENEKVKMECIPFSIAEVVSQTVDAFACSIPEGVCLDRQLDCDSLTTIAKGDPHKICQCLTNVISNALKFTKTGRVTVMCKTNPSRNLRKTWLHLAVTDTGIGMSKSVLSRLFKPFSQADESTTRLYGGTGLGLAITQSLVKSMGGEIKVESNEGKGSTISFYVALQYADNKKEEKSHRPPNKIEPYHCYTASRLAPKVSGDVPTLLDPCKIPGLTTNEESVRQFNRRSYSLQISGSKKVSRWGTQEEDTQDRVESKEPSKSTTATTTTTTTSTSTSIHVSSRTRKKVMVADDNPMVRKLLKTMIERMGHDCLCTTNGIEAVKECETCEYDAIILDMQMPFIDGCEASTLIKHGKNGANKNTPIIILTASIDSDTKEKASECSVSYFATKPISFEELRTLLAESF